MNESRLTGKYRTKETLSCISISVMSVVFFIVVKHIAFTHLRFLSNMVIVSLGNNRHYSDSRYEILAKIVILSEIISSITLYTNNVLLGTIWFVWTCKTLYEHLIYFSFLTALYIDGQNFLLPKNLLMIWCNNFATTFRAIVNIRPVSGLHLKFSYLICCEYYNNENETNQVKDNTF